jgi:hypothetical protein
MLNGDTSRCLATSLMRADYSAEVKGFVACLPSDTCVGSEGASFSRFPSVLMFRSGVNLLWTPLVYVVGVVVVMVVVCVCGSFFL